MTADVPTAHAFAIERALRVYLARQGRTMIPCYEFAGRNDSAKCAPVAWLLQDGRFNRLILPDMIEIPSFDGFELKTQGYAPLFRMAQKRTTGCSRFHYDHYRFYERFTGRRVSIAFVHLCENEIRGGALDDIEHARTDRVNGHSNREYYWEYDALPVLFDDSLTDILDLALRVSPQLGTHAYTATDHDTVMAYITNYAKTNSVAHAAKWADEIQEPCGRSVWEESA